MTIASLLQGHLEIRGCFLLLKTLNAVVTVRYVNVHCHSLGIFLLEIQAKMILPLTINYSQCYTLTQSLLKKHDLCREIIKIIVAFGDLK